MKQTKLLECPVVAKTPLCESRHDRERERDKAWLAKERHTTVGSAHKITNSLQSSGFIPAIGGLVDGTFIVWVHGDLCLAIRLPMHRGC